MAVSPIEYRHQYVSGIVTVPVAGFPAVVLAQVSNRGGTEGRARALIWVENAIVLDSQDGLVEPHNEWTFEHILVIDGIDPVSISYRVQVLTTSPDLVPNAALKETVWSDGQDQGLREAAYFAPGDFALFSLHPSPIPRPPVGPPIEI